MYLLFCGVYSSRKLLIFFSGDKAKNSSQLGPLLLKLKLNGISFKLCEVDFLASYIIPRILEIFIKKMATKILFPFTELIEENEV